MKIALLFALIVCAICGVPWAIRQGQKAQQELEKDWHSVAGERTHKAHAIYMRKLRQGATEDEAWEAARAYEKRFMDKL